MINIIIILTKLVTIINLCLSILRGCQVVGGQRFFLCFWVHFCILSFRQLISPLMVLYFFLQAFGSVCLQQFSIQLDVCAILELCMNCVSLLRLGSIFFVINFCKTRGISSKHFNNSFIFSSLLLVTFILLCRIFFLFL